MTKLELQAAYAHERLVQKALDEACQNDSTMMIVYEEGRRATADRIRAIEILFASSGWNP